MLNLIPAYGRSYANEADVLTHWLANKDFMVNDRTCELNGKYCNREDLRIYAPGTKYARVQYAIQQACIIDIKAGTLFKE